MENLMFYTDTYKGSAEDFYLKAFGIDASKWLMAKTGNQHNGKELTKKMVDAEMKRFFDTIPVAKQLKLILTNNANYFKSLTGVTKVESYIGASMKCVYSDAKVVYTPSIGSVLYSPNKYTKYLNTSMELVKNLLANTVVDKVNKVLKNYHRVMTKKGVKKALNMLLDRQDVLTVDVEAYSLDHPKAGLGTIAFGLNESSAISIPVDHSDKGRKVNKEVRALLKDFFIRAAKRDQKHVYHNIAYDAKVLVYSLFMENIIDRKGMLEGIDIIMNNWEDTQIISYLCFNSTDRPDLGLKFLALEYAGNWAELVGDDIKDISKVDSETLCWYNGIDCGATFYVFKKNYPILIEEDQEEIYLTKFKPTQKVLIKAQLTGICIDMEKVIEVENNLTTAFNKLIADMGSFKGIAEFNEKLRIIELEKVNSKLKNKKDLSSIDAWLFNPSSDEQIRRFLYTVLKIPVEHTTDSGQPATNAKALDSALSNHNVSESSKVFIRLLADYNKIAIILSTFIPSFKNAYLGEDGEYYVFGNYKITGTVSMRLSSNNPNLQNIPAHSEYGELIKACVKAPKGYIMIGLDADSLEDKISALTTKDPNKLAVYIDGLDGHCFNAYGYFTEEMPDIDPLSVASINSIKKLYPTLRQESKPYTFLLTYQGGIGAMVRQFGISREKAKRIYDSYHLNYQVSMSWVQDKLEQARHTGYVVGAFGLKIRVPLMYKTRNNSPKMRPYAVRKEEKTAGNALGQSWCALTNRNAVDMDERLKRDGKELDIRLCMLIHDALYYYVKATPEDLKYTNDNLVDCFSWQDHPDIWHDLVKLSGTMSIFYPSWKVETEVPKFSSLESISSIYEDLING